MVMSLTGFAVVIFPGRYSGLMAVHVTRVNQVNWSIQVPWWRTVTGTTRKKPPNISGLYLAAVRKIMMLDLLFGPVTR